MHILTLIVAITIIVAADQFTGKVVRVIDGDSIEIIHSDQVERVRLYGIDTPERQQPYGSQSTHFTDSLANEQLVTVQVIDVDRYGRTVGIVILSDSTILNHKLVEYGLVWWYREYAPDDTILSRLERQSKIAKAGLWSQPKPVPPWSFRHNRKQTGN